VDHPLPNMDVPHHEDGTCIEDKDSSPTVELQSHRIHSDAHSGTAHQQQQQQNKMDQDTITMMKDAVHNETTTR